MSDVLSYRVGDDSVAVSWSLPDLPTSLHKAGLAGLLCYLRRMPEFTAQDSIPIIETVTPHELQVRFTEASLRTLMDSVYAGEKQLVQSRTRPKAELIVHWRNENPEDRWVVLWRDAMRGVLRDSRAGEIYTWTIKGKSPTKQSGDLKGLWTLLVSAARGRDSVSGPVPTSMYVGAEKKSFERVEFKGEVQHNFLLHFWPFVSPIFRPKTLRRVRDTGNGWIEEPRGYVFAVAEVGNVIEFSDMIDSYWRRHAVPSDSRRIPRECEIDVTAEGGVRFLYALAVNRLQSMDDGDFFDAVPQVDLYHLERRGNNVRTLESDSVRASAGTLRRYERVAASPRNVLFRRLLMRNLLDGLPWHARAAETLFARYPVSLFVCSESFGRAVEDQFRQGRDIVNDKLSLAGKVFDIVGEFVTSRAEKRSEITRGQLPRDYWKSSDKSTQDYLKAREKVAIDAFLAIRGRNSDEFVEYFVGAICAVPQFMGAKGVRPRDGFIEIAQALHESEERRVELKNLTMLALSAHGSSQRQLGRAGGDISNTGDAK